MSKSNYVYFKLGKKQIEEFRKQIPYLTPNKLYLVAHSYDGDRNVIELVDDTGQSVTIHLNRCAHLNVLPKGKNPKWIEATYAVVSKTRAGKTDLTIQYEDIPSSSKELANG